MRTIHGDIIPGEERLFDAWRRRDAEEAKHDAARGSAWEVQVKGEKCSSGWEISVVRKNNGLGHRSWGWFDENKLLISHNGGPCGWPILEFVWDAQIKCAHALCEKLNKEEGRE